MKVSFNIHYPTVWGQTIHLIGSTPSLGEWDTEKAINLHYSDKHLWSVSIEIPDNTKIIEYKYFLKSNGKVFFEPWNKNYRVIFEDTHSTYFLYDHHLEKPENLSFYSSAFTKVLFKHDDYLPAKKTFSDKTIYLKVFAPWIKKHQNVALIGNQKILGNWDTKKALKMSCENFPEYEITFDASGLSYPVEYKFIIYNNNNEEIIWETGLNRVLEIPPVKSGETAIISGLFFKKDFPDPKYAGTAIPVFSLRSENGFGIGDFNDLKKLVDWVKITGQKIIQILPINDTTMNHSYTDSYPYNAISIYALHPLYLNLQQMGTLKNDSLNKKLEKKQKELNSLTYVDYEQTDKFKWIFFREIFSQEGNEVLASKGFKEFFKQNKTWLIPYASYSYLRDIKKTANFNEWGEYAIYNERKVTNLSNPNKKHYPEIAIYFYLQYHLHLQLTEAKNYAHSQGIILKGDIPIGISKTGIEAWKESWYFNMDTQVGAPPDDFSETGQNWGFPGYNWDIMEKDGFSWWKKRFQHMANYFDAYRIDHILGFFRIWEIPVTSIHALNAYFNPSLPFSLDEIKQAGMNLDPEKLAHPQINGCFLGELFGVYAQEVGEKYLIRLSSSHFTLHPNVDTQVKIKNHFAEKNDFKSLTIKNALFVLADDFLFIQDKKQPNKYHPRISANKTFIYKELNIQDKHAFDYLYWDYFYHRHNAFWKEQAYKHLIPLISCTDMLVCGEDLGMIPHSVPEVMEDLQILSLEIERMPKQPNIEFENLDKIPYHSVCTTSTHDMPTIREYWEDNAKKTQRYYTEKLKFDGEAPAICPPDICKQIIENHLKSQAMLAIFPLQDWMGINEKIRHKYPEEERINIPANPRHYWKYRMHVSIDDLLQEKELNNTIKEMIEDSQRD